MLINIHTYILAEAIYALYTYINKIIYINIYAKYTYIYMLNTYVVNICMTLSFRCIPTVLCTVRMHLVCSRRACGGLRTAPCRQAGIVCAQGWFGRAL